MIILSWLNYSWLNCRWLGQSKTGLLVVVSSIGAGIATLGWHLNPSRLSSNFLSTSLVLPERRSPLPLVVPAPIIPQTLPPQQARQELGQPHQAPIFTDVPPQHWIYPLLQDLGQRQLLNGFPDGSFRPEKGMTRAELAAQLTQLNLVNRAYASLRSTGQSMGKPSYRDVNPHHWAYRSIQSVVEMGYMTGYPDGSFRPDQPLTRLQVVLSLTRGLGLKPQTDAAQILQTYEDKQEIPAWGIQGLAAGLQTGLIKGRPGSKKLDPNGAVTRAEVIAMVHAVLVYTGDLEASPQP